MKIQLDYAHLLHDKDWPIQVTIDGPRQIAELMKQAIEKLVLDYNATDKPSNHGLDMIEEYKRKRNVFG